MMELMATNDWFKSGVRNNSLNGLIATPSQCQTNLATHLCIYNSGSKLLSEKDYTIGATYSNETEDFWFYSNTSFCHGNNYLLKLFVIARRDLRFSLFLPSNGHNLKDKIIVDEANKYAHIAGPTKEYIFKTTKKDEAVFIKAYRFTFEETGPLNKFPLLLPCKIVIHTSYRVHPDLLNKIKLQYSVQINKALYKTRSEGDFVIESATHKKHPVHLFVAAAHSSVLRDVIKTNNKSFYLNLDDKDVEMVIGFLYNGCIENLSPKVAPKVLMIADMIGLPGMFKLGQKALSTNINTHNAIELAVLAKKYNLKGLSLKVYDFIKQNPELLLSSSFDRLNDVDLMRAMLRHIGNATL